MAKRYFEDLSGGEFLDCKKLVVTREDIIEFARKFDPQPFHVDDNAAKKSIFGGLIPSHSPYSAIRTSLTRLRCSVFNVAYHWSNSRS